MIHIEQKKIKLQKYKLIIFIYFSNYKIYHIWSGNFYFYKSMIIYLCFIIFLFFYMRNEWDSFLIWIFYWKLAWNPKLWTVMVYLWIQLERRYLNYLRIKRVVSKWFWGRHEIILIRNAILFNFLLKIFYLRRKLELLIVKHCWIVNENFFKTSKTS